MLNRNSTFDELSKHRVIVFNLFEGSTHTDKNTFDEMYFSKIVNDYIANKELIDHDKDRLLEAFSIKNLSQQNIIVKDNDKNTFSFMDFFHELFNYLNDDKYYKLNNYSLIKFKNTINSLERDFKDFGLKDDVLVEDFIAMLMDEFKNIRQELEKHVRVLDNRVNKLITILENSESDITINRYGLSKEILDINHYFIEPLIEFLKSDSKIDNRKKSMGITTSIRKIFDKLSSNNFDKEAVEVSAFLFNFQNSYMDKAIEMGRVLSRYVKKSVEDIKIHSNIERLYNFLEAKIDEASHGKKANRYLKSTDLIVKIPFLEGLKSRDNLSGSIDYEQEILIADLSWERFTEDMDALEGKKQKIRTHFHEISEKDLALVEQDNFISYGNGILSDTKREILESELTYDDDIFRICHEKLKNKLENYKLFYSVLLVYSLEEELNYIMDFNTKRFINFGGEQLTYYRKRIGAIQHV